MNVERRKTWRNLGYPPTDCPSLAVGDCALAAALAVFQAGGAGAKARGESLVAAAMAAYTDDERERTQLAREAQSLVTAAAA